LPARTFSRSPPQDYRIGAGHAACGGCGMVLPTAARIARFTALTAALVLPFGAAARNPLTSLHPEEFYPDNAEMLATPGEHAPFIMRVQERLKQLGFDAGPANGDFGTKTQAALAQFQLSEVLPAGGQLDDQTLAALGVKRDEAAQTESSAAAGATAPVKPE
jgi:peptidoglycan hydrolase-like protein with peptidoglycan-binding domain